MPVKKRGKVSAEFNMSSLTDIIFLLLIFFMLTSTVVAPNAISLKLPNSSRQSNKATRQPLQLEVTEQRQYLFNGKALAVEALPSALEGAVKADGRAVGEITVILRIHEKVEAQILVDMAQLLQKTGVKMVLATQLAAKE